MTIRPRPDEQGAVVVLVVLLMTTILGMAALVIDVGGLLDEKRQLQNGADAAALAVAHSCALGTCDRSLAAGLADGNAHDGAANVDSVVATVATKQVNVITSTRGNAGSTILPYAFARAVTGSTGKTVHASATATWAPVAGATAVPLAISQCDVDALGISTIVSVLYFHSGGPCAGHDAAGAFGWLDGGCPVALTVGDQVSADPGNSGLRTCLSPRVGTDVLVPVFDTVAGTGTNARYHIVGFAMFHLTGFRFPGDASTPSPCSPPDTCIAGNFIRYVTDGTRGTGTNFGVSTVALVS